MMITMITKRLNEGLGDFYKPVMFGAKIIGILILAVLIVKVGSYVIKKFFEKQKSFKYAITSKRLDTLSTLLVSLFRYSVYIIAFITIMSNVFDFKSVLAAAGIGGVALGLGAQSLIKDIISGFFIVLEDQYAVGDLVTIETMNGTVEEMELRVTKIRNFNGDLHIIPNGEIKKVTNHTRGNKAVIVDIPVAYSNDIRKVLQLATELCEEVAQEFQSIVEAPRVQGITELGKESLNLRIFSRTIPNEHLEVERRIRVLIKERFDREKIKFNDRNLILVNDKNAGGVNEDA